MAILAIATAPGRRIHNSCDDAAGLDPAQARTHATHSTCTIAECPLDDPEQRDRDVLINVVFRGRGGLG